MLDRLQKDPPTITDVARKARVSRATVSRVLNRHQYVRAEVRSRVERAMRALGYRPDQVARSLARRETRTLGLVVSDITNPFYAETARSILEVAQDHEYNVILCNTDNSAALQAKYIEILLQRRVDGIIFGSVFLEDPPVEQLISAGFPCVMFNRRLRSRRGNYIELDNVRASYELTEHLVSLGHRRIGFVAGPATISTASDRVRGYKAALKAAGLTADPALVRRAAFNAEGARHAARELLAAAAPPTAIIARNDMMALGILQAAKDAGVRVPGKLAVVGFDDIEIAGHAQIQLTTMTHHKEEMGRLTVLTILDMIRDPKHFAEKPSQVVLPSKMIVRKTSGHPVDVPHRRPEGTRVEP